jgi:sugar lactone lactonase YvrE
MPRTKISEFSATAADNTDIDGINLGEGMLPSDVNNAMRELMAQLKDLQAGTSGDTIPLTAGGTGATTASAARTALGATTTGNDLFTSASASAARTTLGATTTGNSLFTAADAAAGRTAISAASSGANSNITSLTGLTTALSASQGGTGLTSAGTSGNVLLSNGTGWVSGTVSAGALATASTSGASQTVSFAADAVHNALCDAATVTFTFGSPASVAKVDLILDIQPIKSYVLGSTNFVQRISIATQETSPTGIFFKPDGLKMYIIGSNGDDVNEYDLSTAWDISTASYLQNFSVASQETVPRNIFFKPDGLKMYIIGSSGDDVNEYDLSTAWNISTASYLQNFSVSAQDTVPTAIFFKPDGLKMFITGSTGDDVNEYNLSTAWDVSTASYVQNFSVASQEVTPNGISFKSDGTKMFISGSSEQTINEYNLSTAWNISTASFVRSFDMSVQDTLKEGLFFSPDGDRMYFVGTSVDEVLQYYLNTPWSFESTGFPVYESVFLTGDNAASPKGVFFKPDGTSMYVSCVVSTQDRIVEFSLPTPWQPGSAIFAGFISVESLASNIGGLFFKPDGTRVYFVDVANDSIDECSLSVPWSISSLSFVQSRSVASQDTAPIDVFFKPDGLKMYVLGNTGEDVNEYNLSTAWDVSTASYVQNFSVASQENDPQGIFITENGLKMFITGDTGDDVNEYNLSTAWNISTASFAQSYSVASQLTSPRGIFFKPDGTRFYLASSSDNGIYQYRTGSLPTIVFPSTLESPEIIIEGGTKTAISIITSNTGTSYQAINVQRAIL